MKTRFKATEFLILVVMVLPILYLASVYGSLPSRVPTHFRYDGTPDDYSKKSFLWILVSLMSVLSLGLYL
ncbi:MAG: DUF1648 domain-containing protein, partial [Bacteroidota bacterium]|nr:DUF1648 domain-containing protein [Bacteroidota bacterium]